MSETFYVIPNSKAGTDVTHKYFNAKDEIMTNPVSLSDLSKALDDLIMAEAPPMLAEGDVTVMRLANRAICTPPKARKMLEKWVTEGKAEYIGKRREFRGHAVDAWRLVVKGQ